MFRLRKSKPQSDNSEYVRRLFNHLLGREPDPAALAYYDGLLKQHGDLRIVMDGILASPEYLSRDASRHWRPPSQGPYVWSDVTEAYSADVRNCDIRSILILQVDGIGDFFLALDSYLALRKAFPSASITLLCDPRVVPLAEKMGFFEKAVPIDFYKLKAEEIPGALLPLAKTPFDLALDFHVAPDTRIVLDHVDAKYKCAYEGGHFRSALTLALPQPNLTKAESIACNSRMMMLRLTHEVVELFRPNAEIGAWARQKFAGSAGERFMSRRDKPLVSLQPFSGLAIKNWPFENFIKLASWLCGEMDVSVVALGPASERDSAQAMIEACHSPNLTSAIGEASLVEALSIIGASDLYIGNDTGLTHAAARMGIPTIALYSGMVPTVVWAPHGPRAKVVAAGVDCAPCNIHLLKDCPYGHICMRSISVEFVQSLALEWLPLDREQAASKRAADASAGV